jgi:hypothetical protein
VKSAARRHRLFAGSLLIAAICGAGSLLAQYPSGPVIGKDGTVVLLQDYASLRSRASRPARIRRPSTLRVNWPV